MRTVHQGVQELNDLLQREPDFSLPQIDGGKPGEAVEEIVFSG
jgi:hypothetical protein